MNKANLSLRQSREEKARARQQGRERFAMCSSACDFVALCEICFLVSLQLNATETLRTIDHEYLNES